MSSNSENSNRRYPAPLKAALRIATEGATAPRERSVGQSTPEAAPDAQTSAEDVQRAREEWDRIQDWPGNTSVRPREYSQPLRNVVQWATGSSKPQGPAQ